MDNSLSDALWNLTPEQFAADETHALAYDAAELERKLHDLRQAMHLIHSAVCNRAVSQADRVAAVFKLCEEHVGVSHGPEHDSGSQF